MSSYAPSRRRTQEGAVLVISLVILLAMTLVGITAMQTTVLEERMTGNMRDQNLSFQAGEAGLREALDWVESKVKTATGMPEPKSNGSNLLWQECKAAQSTNDDGDPVGCGDGSTAVEMSWMASNGDDFGDFTNISSVTLNQDGDGNTILSDLPQSIVEERYAPPPEFDEAVNKKGVVHYTVTTLGRGGSAQTRTLVQTTVPILRL